MDTNAAWAAFCNKLSLLCLKTETEGEGHGGRRGGGREKVSGAEKKNWKRDRREGEPGRVVSKLFGGCTDTRHSSAGEEEKGGGGGGGWCGGGGRT